MYRRDTIVAPATPSGRGAVAIVRLSGPEAAVILGKIFFGSASRSGVVEPWRLRHGRIQAADGTAIDEVLAAVMPAPHSYTGEDVAEIQCHGSPLIVEKIVELCVVSGARPAEPGEYTRRAVLNGKLDLVQAEAVADLIDSRVSSGATDAWNQLQGALSAELSAIRQRILLVLADVEANVDFSDDELPAESLPARLDGVDLARRQIEVLLGGFAAARRRRDGWRVVFTGRPNAGKSSLVNALLGSGRMIVSDEPGTTRDVVEETVDLDGTAFVLVDTAGLRDSDSAAETVAVERARATFAAADLILVVVDAASIAEPDDADLVRQLPTENTVLVLSKCDLPRQLADVDVRALSAECGACLEVSAVDPAVGVGPLIEYLLAAAGADSAVPASATARSRHRGALERSRQALVAAHSILSGQAEPELVSIDLRTAADELAAITHPLDNEEVLDIIFRDFCIGK
jgi:tRNA modification GTPase